MFLSKRNIYFLETVLNDNCSHSKMTKKLKMLLFKMSGIEIGLRIAFYECMQ